jgi:hypothetical protein
LITSFKSDEDPQHTGQGLLQGSSSAVPIYTANSDVSLTAYQRMATGTTFTNPITRNKINEHATQYVDDKMEMCNTDGTGIPAGTVLTKMRDKRLHTANNNTNTWTKLMSTSGGNLNPNKCFWYYIEPTYDYSTQQIKYLPSAKTPGEILIDNPATETTLPINRVQCTTGKCTLRVIMAPNGDSTEQITTPLNQTQIYLGKIKCSK